MDWYSTFIVVPHTQGAQVRITQCYLQITPYLPLPRKHSPDGASPDWGCGHLIAAYYSFIYPKGWKAEYAQQCNSWNAQYHSDECNAHFLLSFILFVHLKYKKTQIHKVRIKHACRFPWQNKIPQLLLELLHSSTSQVRGNYVTFQVSGSCDFPGLREPHVDKVTNEVSDLWTTRMNCWDTHKHDRTIN